MKCTVHVGPKGGIQYRMWKSDTVFKIVSKYVAWPHMSEAEQEKAETMIAERRAKAKRKAFDQRAWRDIQSGRLTF